LELEGFLSVVQDFKIDVGIGACGTTSKWLASIAVRKYIVAMSPSFNDCQGSMDGHPKDKIRKLAESTSNSF
jgi:hypothetical protein